MGAGAALDGAGVALAGTDRWNWERGKSRETREAGKFSRKNGGKKSRKTGEVSGEDGGENGWENGWEKSGKNRNNLGIGNWVGSHKSSAKSDESDESFKLHS